MLDKPRRLGDDLMFRTKRGRQFRQVTLHLAWAPARDAFTASLPETHHLRDRLVDDLDDRLDFYELRHFRASHMLNVLEPEPWVIAEQLHHSDGGALVGELYGHPERAEAVRRIRRAFIGGKGKGLRGIRGRGSYGRSSLSDNRDCAPDFGPATTGAATGGEAGATAAEPLERTARAAFAPAVGRSAPAT